MSRLAGKVLGVFTPSLDRGGAERFLIDLLSGCRGRGFAARVIAYSAGPVAEELEAEGVEVRIAPEPPHWDDERYEEGVRRLGSAIEGCDVVLTNTLWAWHGADAARRSRLPCVWMIHDHFDLPTASAHLLRRPTPGVLQHMQEAYLASSFLVFPTEATRAVHVDGGAPAERTAVVPLGVDVAIIDSYRQSFDRASTRQRLGFAEDDCVLLSIGRLQPSKGQSILIRAAATLDDIPGLRVVLLGKSAGTYAGALEELVRRSGCEGRVRIEPETPNVHDWYGIADAYVCASDLESLPLTLLEAAAWGLSLISTPVGGITEFIEDGVNGRLVPPSDIAALAESLREVVCGSWDRAREMGERAGAAARARRSREWCQNRFLDLLSDAAREEPRTS